MTILHQTDVFFENFGDVQPKLEKDYWSRTKTKTSHVWIETQTLSLPKELSMQYTVSKPGNFMLVRPKILPFSAYRNMSADLYGRKVKIFIRLCDDMVGKISEFFH